MARTAPCPNIPPIPGMCPSVAILGGGGDGGGGSGSGGSGGDGSASASGQGGGDDASGDGKSACGSGGGDGGGCPNHHGSSQSGTGAAGDPVDVVTGRVFTVPVTDLELSGPLPLKLDRTYSSEARHRDVGLGPGFTHSLAWEVWELRSKIRLRTHDGLDLDFDDVVPGEGSLTVHGWILHRDGPGFALDLTDGTRLLLYEGSPVPGGMRYRLSFVTDRYGNRISLAYREGVLREIVDCVGRVVAVHANQDGRIEALSLKNAPAKGKWVTVARYAYDDAGRLSVVEDADGAKTSFTYDERNLLVSQTRPSGLTFHYRYDREARCVETWGDYPDGRDPSLAGDVPKYLADKQTPAKGIYHAKLFFMDDGYSEVTTSLTTHRYFGNSHGKIDKAVSCGGVFTREFDDLGCLLSFTDACGATTTYERDFRGRETKIVDALGHATRIARDPDGHIREIVEPGGAVTTVERRPGALCWRDALGANFEVRYDARGLIEQTIAPNGDVTQYRYDQEANLVEIVDARGNISRATYDAWGRGEVHRFVRRLDGLVVEEHTFDGRTLCYKYDAMGRLLETVNGENQKAVLERDILGRIVLQTGSDDSEVRFAYDPRGDVIRASSDQVEVLFERNAVGWIVRETQSIGADSVAVETEYDLMGRTLRRATSRGHSLSWERNGGRASVLLDGSERVELGFDSLGREVVRQLEHGGRIESSYDLMGRLAARRVLGVHRGPHITAGEPEWVGALPGAATIEKQYSYSAALLSEKWDREAGLTRFDYDPLGRLLAVVPEKIRAELFHYGPGGDLHEAPGSSRTYGAGRRCRMGSPSHVKGAGSRAAIFTDPLMNGWSYSLSQRNGGKMAMLLCRTF